MLNQKAIQKTETQNFNFKTTLPHLFIMLSFLYLYKSDIWFLKSMSS